MRLFLLHLQYRDLRNANRKTVVWGLWQSYLTEEGLSTAKSEERQYNHSWSQYHSSPPNSATVCTTNLSCSSSRESNGLEYHAHTLTTSNALRSNGEAPRVKYCSSCFHKSHQSVCPFRSSNTMTRCIHTIQNLFFKPSDWIHCRVFSCFENIAYFSIRQGSEGNCFLCKRRIAKRYLSSNGIYARKLLILICQL